MKRRTLSIALTLGLIMAAASLGAASRKARTLTPKQARHHVGETATVCGRVASAHLAYRSRGQPTFLNLGRPYPHQVFTAVIWGLDRGKFGRPEEQYLHRRICVTGRIKAYRGQPEMVLKDPVQVGVKKDR